MGPWSIASRGLVSRPGRRLDAELGSNGRLTLPPFSFPHHPNMTTTHETRTQKLVTHWLAASRKEMFFFDRREDKVAMRAMCFLKVRLTLTPNVPKRQQRSRQDPRQAIRHMHHKRLRCSNSSSSSCTTGNELFLLPYNHSTGMLDPHFIWGKFAPMFIDSRKFISIGSVIESIPKANNLLPPFICSASLFMPPLPLHHGGE